MPALAKPDSALGQFQSLAFDAQSKRAVTTHHDSSNGVRVWDSDTGQLLVVMCGHSGEVTDASFSPDGRRVLSASRDGTAKVWDSESGVCLLSLQAHGFGLESAVFSPDGCYIAAGSVRGDVQLWSGGSVCLATFVEHIFIVTHLVFSPDGRTSCSGDDAGIVCLRDICGFIEH